MKQVYEYNRAAITELLIADMKDKGVSFDGYAGAIFEFGLDKDTDELCVKVELKKEDEVSRPIKEKAKANGREKKMSPDEFSEFIDEFSEFIDELISVIAKPPKKQD